MAARAQSRSRSSVKTIRLTTAFLLIVLAFTAGFTVGAFVPGGGPQKAAPSGSSQAASEAESHIESAERLTQKEPNSPKAWKHLGDMYFDTGAPQKALEAYEKSIALDPSNPDVITDLGTCYRQVGKYEQALAKYNDALTLQPRHVNARMNKGIVLYYDLKRKDEALKVWEGLLSLNQDAKAPNNELLKDFIARHRSNN